MRKGMVLALLAVIFATGGCSGKSLRKSDEKSVVVEESSTSEEIEEKVEEAEEVEEKWDPSQFDYLEDLTLEEILENPPSVVGIRSETGGALSMWYNTDGTFEYMWESSGRFGELRRYFPDPDTLIIEMPYTDMHEEHSIWQITISKAAVLAGYRNTSLERQYSSVTVPIVTIEQ